MQIGIKHVCLVLFCLTISSCAENQSKPSSSENQGVTKTSNSETTKLPENKIDVQQLSTFSVVDKECKTMVVSTTLTENVTALGNLLLQLEAYNLNSKFQVAVGKSDADKEISHDKIKQLLWNYSKNYVWLPMEAEKYYGEQIHEKSYSNNILPRDDKSKARYEFADNLLKEVLKNINVPYDYNFTLYILKNEGNNALAIAGGNVYLDSGLVGGKDQALAKLSPSEKQKLHDKALLPLAHEITHVLQRHETKHLQTRIMDSVDLAELSSSLSASTLNYTNMSDAKNLNQALTIFSKTLTLISTGKYLFTRNYQDQELQADSCGLVLSSRVLTDQTRLLTSVNALTSDLIKNEVTAPPKASDNKSNVAQGTTTNATSLEAKLQHLHNGLLKDSDLLSSPIGQHPSSAERIDNLKAMYGLLHLDPKIFDIKLKSPKDKKLNNQVDKLKKKLG